MKEVNDTSPFRCVSILLPRVFLTEYAKERQNVGDKSTDHAIMQWASKISTVKVIGLGVAQALPTVRQPFFSVSFH